MGGVFLLIVYTACCMLVGARSRKLHFIFWPPQQAKVVDGIPVMQRMTERGWQNSLFQSGFKADIAFYGNSITYNGQFHQYFPDYTVCNLGLPGDDLNGLIRRISMLRIVEPKKVFVMGGINGSKGIPLESFSHVYDSLVTCLCDSLPQTEIYLQSLLPVNHRVYDTYADNPKICQLNDSIRQIANRHHLTYVDLYSLYAIDGEMPDSLTRDGIHLKPIQYARWADAIRKYVYE